MNAETQDLITDILNTNIQDVVDMEEIVDIDMDEVDKESKSDAHSLIESISRLYTDDNFLRNNPKLCKRIESELETMRILIKMRKADEITHDIVIKAISQKPSNASLYKSLTEVQKAIISITARIDETVKNLEALVKNFQLELNFKDEEEQQESDGSAITDETESIIHRGARDFIVQMKEYAETKAEPEIQPVQTEVE